MVWGFLIWRNNSFEASIQRTACTLGVLFLTLDSCRDRNDEVLKKETTKDCQQCSMRGSVDASVEVPPNKHRASLLMQIWSTCRPGSPARPQSTCTVPVHLPAPVHLSLVHQHGGPACTALGPPAGSCSPVPGPPARPRPPAWPRSACTASVCLYSSSSHEKRAML